MQTCIDGGGHEDDLAVVGVADGVAVDALKQEKQEVDVDVALVHLVQDDVRVALERWLRFAVDELLEQRARRAVEQLRLRRVRHLLQAHLVAHSCACEERADTNV